MNNLAKKEQNKLQRKRRVRSVVRGSAERPRLTVFISNNNISAQLINDDKSETLCYVTTINKKSLKGTMTEKASAIGKDIALAAKAKKIKRVVFDRNGRLYHGRIAALADSARKEGLEF